MIFKINFENLVILKSTCLQDFESKLHDFFQNFHLRHSSHPRQNRQFLHALGEMRFRKATCFAYASLSQNRQNRHLKIGKCSLAALYTSESAIFGRKCLGPDSNRKSAEFFRKRFYFLRRDKTCRRTAR